MARTIEQAPAWVRELLPPADVQAASHAEAQAALDAVRSGDRSQVVSFEALSAWLDSLEEPGAEAV
jgi:hypothetical protein